MAAEKDSRLEERFWSRSAIALLVLIVASPTIPVIGWIPLFLLYLIGATYYAKVCGVDEIVYALSLLTAHLTKDKSEEEK